MKNVVPNSDDLKDEKQNVKTKMGLFGRGRGPLGLPVALTGVFIVTFILLTIFLLMGIYLVYIGQVVPGFMAFASGIMFLGFMMMMVALDLIKI